VVQVECQFRIGLGASVAGGAHLIVFGEAHLRRVLQTYARYYSRDSPDDSQTGVSVLLRAIPKIEALARSLPRARAGAFHYVRRQRIPQLYSMGK
jgi:hypothetical protein